MSPGQQRGERREREEEEEEEESRRGVVHGLPEGVDMTSTNNRLPFFAVYFNRLLRTSIIVSVCCTYFCPTVYSERHLRTPSINHTPALETHYTLYLPPAPAPGQTSTP